MQLTYYGANSWLVELADRRLLIDPWLVSSLVFGNLPWLFKGDRPNPPAIPQNIDAIVLSQGLEDHAHKPTLKILDRTIPVIGSPNAARVVRELGYQNVTELTPGETHILAEAIEIRAFPGAPIGLQKENAFLITDLSSKAKIYYEPHGFPPEEIKNYAPVDVVINPVVNLELPLAGAIINGQQSAYQLAQWLRPQVMLPTAAGGDVDYQGVLISLLQAKGSLEELRSRLSASHPQTRVIDPQPGEPLTLDLQTQVA